jgi:diguanylate cyclase (GGDEF)-like protein
VHCTGGRRAATYAVSVAAAESPHGALDQLAERIRDGAFELALEVVQEGLHDDQIPSLQRLGQDGQLGDVPTFVVELAKELADPEPARVRRGGPLAALVRDHARVREELGFAPREVVMEFLILRRVLWRFVSRAAAGLQTGDVLLIERRLNDTIDRLVAECVVAYFDRATFDLANQARSDPLTQLLNHQAFSEHLEAEVDRARRYGHGLTLAFLDVDRFKEINDTLGHPEGDKVLREVAGVLQRCLRAADLAGRMGGDEFAVALMESDRATGAVFVDRLDMGIEQAVAERRLPHGFGISPGLAHFPTDAWNAQDLLRFADERLYETKRARGTED